LDNSSMGLERLWY